jgi:peptidoglycan hydrolase-like protein with peptidoglycan-binding domain
MQSVGRHISIAGGIGLMLLAVACSHKSTPQASSGTSVPPPHAKQASARLHGNVAMLPVTRQTVQQLQRELQQDGFYHGPIDGVVGAQTHEAVAAYQREHGLQQTAALDWPTLQQLTRGGAPAGASPESSTSGSSTAIPGNPPPSPSGTKPPQSGQSP